MVIKVREGGLQKQNRSGNDKETLTEKTFERRKTMSLGEIKASRMMPGLWLGWLGK